ncbi:hypothetical protein Zmor_014062 [Zophobas morio]|uniref:Uncharacterized protein n=1 Tax=Zophobas morio TaxID=2755281 RepID=A0AA38MG41_9CUCU|nr:hypothetical protein Zmor_014062 [Zophobas morio]
MEIGYPLMRSINENFMATALLINICFELFSVTCLYGIRNFCDDVDFMLGFVPNYFFQATWLILPGLFAVFSIASVCIKFKKLQNEYDLFVWCLILLFTIVPIFAIGVYKCCVEFKVLGFKQMFRPKLRQSEWENTPGDGDLSASFAKDYFPEN